MLIVWSITRVLSYFFSNLHTVNTSNSIIIQLYDHLFLFCSDLFIKNLEALRFNSHKRSYLMWLVLSSSPYETSFYLTDLSGNRKRNSNAYEVAHMMIEWPPTYKQLLYFATFPILYVWEAATAFLHLFLSMFVKQLLLFCQISPLLSSPLICR